MIQEFSCNCRQLLKGMLPNPLVMTLRASWSSLDWRAVLPALTTCGYDLDTLVKGAARGSAFSITPDNLKAALQDVGHSLPIGSCTKIMLRAEEIHKQLRMH